MPSVQLKVKGTIGVLEDKHMLKEAADGSQLYWSQIWSSQQSQAPALLDVSEWGWCWLWEASCCCSSCWHWLPPCCPWSSSSTSPSLCSSSLHPHMPWPHKPNKLLPRASPPSPRWHQWKHLSSGLMWWDCGWQGCLMTALGVCLVWAKLFQLSRTQSSAFPTFSGKMSSARGHSFCCVWQKMSSTLCYWDTWGHLFCIVMERTFLVSRMLAAVTSNPESGLFDQCKPPWTWNNILPTCCTGWNTVWGKEEDFYLD